MNNAFTRHRNLYHRLSGLLLLLLYAVPCSQAAADQPMRGKKTLQRTVDPVIIQGSELPSLIGTDIGNIRVYAYRNGKPAPIPFQIDQRDSTDCWVWDVVYRERFQIRDDDEEVVPLWDPYRRGPGTFDDQDPPGTALLDANDELVFMAADLGDRHDNPLATAAAARVLEIESADTTNGTSGWAYIALHETSPPPRSAVRYLQYNTRNKTVTSSIYSFHYSDIHTALIHDLRINNVPVVDRIKVNGEIKLSLALGKKKLYFNEEDIHGHTAGYIAGPVRIVKRNLAQIILSGGLVTTPEVTCDHFYYARHAQVPVCMSIRFPVKKISMTLTTDYRDPPFQALFMGKAQDTGPPGGRDHPLWSRLHRLGTEWIALDSQHASVISLLVVPANLEGHAYANPCLCRGQEDAVDVQLTPGKHTEAGFLVTSTLDTPRGQHVLYGTYLISARPYEPGDENLALMLNYEKLKTYITPLPPAD